MTHPTHVVDFDNGGQEGGGDDQNVPQQLSPNQIRGAKIEKNTLERQIKWYPYLGLISIAFAGLLLNDVIGIEDLPPSVQPILNNLPESFEDDTQLIGFVVLVALGLWKIGWTYSREKRLKEVNNSLDSN